MEAGSSILHLTSPPPLCEEKTPGWHVPHNSAAPPLSLCCTHGYISSPLLFSRATEAPTQPYDPVLLKQALHSQALLSAPRTVHQEPARRALCKLVQYPSSHTKDWCSIPLGHVSPMDPS